MHSFKRIYSNVLTGSVSTIDITGLNGDTDIEYEIHCYFVMSANCNVRLQFNNDTGTNYRIAGGDFAYLETPASITNTNAFANIKIYAKSGGKRNIILTSSTIDAGFASSGGWWKNTADNITSIKFSQSSTATFNAGTLIEIYARR